MASLKKGALGVFDSTCSTMAEACISLTACNQPEDMDSDVLAELPRPRAGFEALDCAANAASQHDGRHPMRFAIRKQTWR